MYALLSLIRMFWPFFKEVLFGRASFQAWLKANRHTLFWIGIVLIMLYVVIRLATIISELSHNLQTVQRSNIHVITADKALIRQLQWSQQVAEALRDEVAWSRRVLQEELTQRPPDHRKSPGSNVPKTHNQLLIDQLNRWHASGKPSVPTKP